MVIAFAKYLGANCIFYDLHSPDQIIPFLNTKIKSEQQDPDRRWITTWNYYLVHIKLFLRWLHNCGSKDNVESLQRMPDLNWETPPAARIKKKRTKRQSPYSESEIWDREEVLTVIKYEPEIRNKAIIALLWDLDARNHEITSLKIGNIRLRERYAEGEIPYNTKTGGGPILLTCSFPYVRDWLNKHPFKNTAEARLICSLRNGAPIKPEALWTMMKQLKQRIEAMVGNTKDSEEKEKLEYLLRTKKWNPYCLRHSAITYDSDYLPEYAVKKKARWSMNSRQGSRYIKSRMGGDLKRAILVQNGIALGDDNAIRPKPAVRDCPKCNLINTFDNKYCSKCSYPLVPDAFDEIKLQEDLKIKAIERKYEQEMKAMRQEMEDRFKDQMRLMRESQSEILTLLKDPDKLMAALHAK
jgi:integrase/recombinase XerD